MCIRDRFKPDDGTSTAGAATAAAAMPGQQSQPSSPVQTNSAQKQAQASSPAAGNQVSARSPADAGAIPVQADAGSSATASTGRQSGRDPARPGGTLDNQSETRQTETSGVEASEAEPAQPMQPAVLKWQPEQWISIVEELPVSGLPLQLARNCALVSATGDTVQLQLDPEYSTLGGPRSRERLRQKMSVYADGEVQLKVEVPKTLSGSTPAIVAKAADKARLDEARSAIEDDPVVQEICKQFDGTVSTGSIKPVQSDNDGAAD